ncbi:response regulator [Alcaligenes ammonioxydans]|jgi:DNA-binding NtrC family response regulator|uniref:Response regulator n=1 Tax=Alcaligenes ammonioxydans TaxID=2582914 RepID=A0ABX8SW12_9BURK|nr:response regulator [Alcaligenes ammonioxydans]EJC63011.1 two-component system response regulator [Alcaligenes faecalis subsp. faecalis NCIB 8687]QBH19128.1 response regulator [Alcaligenes faecalis]MCH1880982.1 response regulator [Alcaligenes ammonioxydans]QXX80237.1 response regulator [Alcaligenes ammonioxydans]WGQ35216.1 response regulator [Alcaligenes faecalis]
MARILVVDDEIGIRELLSEILYDEGHTVQLAENAAQAREARLRGRPDLVLLDIWMPDTDGVSLLKEWASQGLLDMPVVMMSGHATVDTAVEATRIGAVDFLEKPITMQRLLKTVASGLERTVAPKTLAAAARPVVQGGERRPEAAPMAPGMAPAMTVPEVEQDESQLGSISLDLPLREARDEFERIYFEYHLRRENHSMTRVSERTGLERTHLYRKLKQLGIDSSRKRNQS